MSVRILTGDCRDVLKTLPGESVHCVVTSPPYFGLRDYKTGTWDGGDPACSHVVGEMRRGLGLANSVVSVRGGGHKAAEVNNIQAKGECPHCGARRIDRQLGLEPTHDCLGWATGNRCEVCFVCTMVSVFREVRRVLRSDGTLWLNLGDTYAGSGGLSPQSGKLFKGRSRQRETICLNSNYGGVRPKNLLGIPWRTALALQADGWNLRQDDIWSKPNPMPESVEDRCTKSHEYVFHLTKSGNYYFDREAIAEPVTATTIKRLSQKTLADQGGSFRIPDKKDPVKAHVPAGQKDKPLAKLTRNKRSVWTVATQPFKGAHFAVMAPGIAEPCIKASCPPGGVVLDPFGGAGTTGMIADRLGRDAILIELNPDFVEIAKRRITEDSPLLSQVAA